MQIVVPAAGRGQRFLERGYAMPKPLIEVLGKPLIKWSTDGLQGVEGARFIFLVLQEHIEKHQIGRRLTQLYPGCAVVPVHGVTLGAACTVLLAKPKLDLDDELFIVNCDNLFAIDWGFVRPRLSPTTDGVILYFASQYERWSYVASDERGYAVRVVEKEVISDKATVGCYYFRQARLFTEAAEYMVQHDLRTKGEFYVSPTYNILLEQGRRIQVFPVDLHYSLGTPDELESFRTMFHVGVRENAIV